MGEVEVFLLWLKEPYHASALRALVVISFYFLVMCYGVFRLGRIITVRVMRRVADARSIALVVTLPESMMEKGESMGDTKESTSTWKEDRQDAHSPDRVPTLSSSIGSAESTAHAMDQRQAEEIKIEDTGVEGVHTDAFEYPPLPEDDEDDFTEDRTYEDEALVVGLGPLKAVGEAGDHGEHGQECLTAESLPPTQAICAGQY